MGSLQNQILPSYVIDMYNINNFKLNYNQHDDLDQCVSSIEAVQFLMNEIKNFAINFELIWC